MELTIETALESWPTTNPRSYLGQDGLWEESKLLADCLLDPQSRLITWEGPLPWAQSVDSPAALTSICQRIERYRSEKFSW